MWEQQFAGDPRALGATIRVNGVPLTIVGIAPAGFDYPPRTAVWIMVTAALAVVGTLAVAALATWSATRRVARLDITQVLRPDDGV